MHITYCIDESGMPQNVSVLDSVGGSIFEPAAVRAAEQWRFEPAMHDGAPVWQSRNETYLYFRISGREAAAAKPFTRRYRQINKLVDGGKLDEAMEVFQETFDHLQMSLYEMAMLWVTRVRLEAATGDLYKLRMALHRAMVSEGEWLGDETYWAFLKLDAQVEAQLGKWRESLSTRDRLAKLAGEDHPLVRDLDPLVESIKQQMNGSTPLRIPAEIRERNACAMCDDSWEFLPFRNTFTLANVEGGSLRSIEMRCDRARFVSDVSDAVDWTIPESWGDCRVQVFGQPGTTFDVVLLTEEDI